MKTTTTAKVLSVIANKHEVFSEDLAALVGVSRATAVKHARKLAEMGMVFCDDDFEGRNRRGGKYANALWVLNCYSNGFDEQTAQRALDMVVNNNGYSVLVDELELGC